MMTSSHRSRRAAQRAGKNALTIAAASPQVISLRLAQMAASGMNPSARDQREMKRMSDEKLSAFNESCVAVSKQMMRMQQNLMATWLSSAFRPTLPHRLAHNSGQAMVNGMAQMAAAGLAPMSKRVASNARRLTLRGVKPPAPTKRRG